MAESVRLTNIQVDPTVKRRLRMLAGDQDLPMRTVSSILMAHAIDQFEAGKIAIDATKPPIHSPGGESPE